MWMYIYYGCAIFATIINFILLVDVTRWMFKSVLDMLIFLFGAPFFILFGSVMWIPFLLENGYITA